MKTLKYLTSLALVCLFISCAEDNNDLSFIEEVVAPSNITAQFQITQDNSGLVTITPNAEGAVSFNITPGDGSDVVSVLQGENFDNIYTEGTYTVQIEATGITGLKTIASQDLTVSFKAPENLEISADIDASNPFIINVSATADFATSYLVYFDTANADEEPTALASGETVSFEYPSVGDYTIRVVALSGGAETSEVTQDVSITSPTELPIDFEAFDANTFQGFGGASNAVIDNPDTNGNLSSKVGQIIKGAGETWAGNVITLSSPIDFSTKKAMTMDVWSPRAGGKMILKIENLDDGNIFYENEVTLTGNSAWEEVTFDLSGIDTSNAYQKVVVFFDFGTMGDGSADWTFYIDNINQAIVSSGGSSSEIIQNFEGSVPTFTDFGNIAPIEVVANPDATGVNTTDNVARLIKSSGSEVWAGAFFDVSTPLDIENNNRITVKTWSPKSGATVRFKIENSVDNTQFHEVDAITSSVNSWEELSFDISTANTSFTYDRIVIFFDFGIAGDDSTYYYDEITLVNDSSGANSAILFQDFEDTVPTFTDFGNIAPVEVVANPDATGVNTTDNVARLIKSNGSEVWAGAFFDVSTPLDVSSFNQVTIKTWSPKSGATVRFKIENSTDNTQFYEVDATTSLENSWEELTFDISTADTSFTYDRVVMFFDFGNAGDDSVYYFDEFELKN